MNNFQVEGNKRFLIFSNKAIELGNSISLAPMSNDGYSSAPIGRYVLIKIEERNNEEIYRLTFAILDVTKNKISSIRSVDQKNYKSRITWVGASSILQFGGWFAASASGIMTVREPDSKIAQNYIFNAASQSVIPFNFPGTAFVFSPKRPVAFLRGKHDSLHIIRSDGDHAEIPCPEKIAPIGWSISGDQIYLVASESENGISVAKRWYGVDIAASKVRLLMEKPTIIVDGYQDAKESLPVRFRREYVTLKEGVRLCTLWMDAKDAKDKDKLGKLLICGDIDDAMPELLNDLSAVLYQHQGYLYYRPLMSIDPNRVRRLHRRPAT